MSEADRASTVETGQFGFNNHMMRITEEDNNIASQIVEQSTTTITRQIGDSQSKTTIERINDALSTDVFRENINRSDDKETKRIKELMNKMAEEGLMV
jgi:hypothetical protein